MSASLNRKNAAIAVSLALAVGALVALGASSAFLASVPAAHTADPVTASGNTQQWAFGGSAGAAYSCSGSACGDNSTISSLSLHYFIEWVVIYTATNISATQTEFEAQAAINATLSLSLQGCETGSGSTCTAIQASASLSGLETATGFTNVTNAGSVDLSSGAGSPGDVPALAILNAQSNAAFNFSGSFSATLPVNGTEETGSANFDLGGSESSGITFSTPLGVVPINPQPGQWWNSSAPYSATGTFTSGYSLSESVDGHSQTDNNWQSSAVAPSGTLSLTGEDLGATTLSDNYTTPPSTVSAQEIVLSFGTDDFAGAHGWMLIPSGLYSGAFGVFSGISLIAGQPAASTSFGTSESADFEPGVGFVAESAVTSGSSLGVGGGPTVNIQTGPEPVSVASQQYSAVIASQSSGSSSFPWVDLVVVAVVVVVVAVVGVFLVTARMRRGPPGQGVSPYVGSVGSGATGPGTAGGPGMMDPTSPPPPPPSN